MCHTAPFNLSNLHLSTTQEHQGNLWASSCKQLKLGTVSNTRATSWERPMCFSTKLGMSPQQHQQAWRTTGMAWVQADLATPLSLRCSWLPRVTASIKGFSFLKGSPTPPLPKGEGAKPLQLMHLLSTEHHHSTLLIKRPLCKEPDGA